LCSHLLSKQQRKKYSLVSMLPVSQRYAIPLRPRTWTPVGLGSLDADGLVCSPAVASQILKSRSSRILGMCKCDLKIVLYALIGLAMHAFIWEMSRVWNNAHRRVGLKHHEPKIILWKREMKKENKFYETLQPIVLKATAELPLPAVVVDVGTDTCSQSVAWNNTGFSSRLLQCLCRYSLPKFEILTHIFILHFFWVEQWKDTRQPLFPLICIMPGSCSSAVPQICSAGTTEVYLSFNQSCFHWNISLWKHFYHD